MSHNSILLIFLMGFFHPYSWAAYCKPIADNARSMTSERVQVREQINQLKPKVADGEFQLPWQERLLNSAKQHLAFVEVTLKFPQAMVAELETLTQLVDHIANGQQIVAEIFDKAEAEMDPLYIERTVKEAILNPIQAKIENGELEMSREDYLQLEERTLEIIKSNSVAARSLVQIMLDRLNGNLSIENYRTSIRELNGKILQEEIARVESEKARSSIEVEKLSSAVNSLRSNISVNRAELDQLQKRNNALTENIDAQWIMNRDCEERNADFEMRLPR